MHQATLNIRSKSQWEMRAQKPTVIMMKKFFGSFEVIRLRKTFPVFSQHPVGYHAGKQIESAVYCFNIFVFMNVLVFSSNTRVGVQAHASFWHITLAALQRTVANTE